MPDKRASGCKIKAAKPHELHNSEGLLSDMQNDLQITIAHHGAELVSIQYGGREYMWNGDTEYWGRIAPILFPIVGRLSGDTLRIKGREFQMKQHGFARDAEFSQSGIKVDSIIGKVLLQTCQPPLKFIMSQYGKPQNYPYDFELSVSYEIQGQIVSCSWEVLNTGKETMHFQIGAHPAFMLPNYNANEAIHGYLQCYDVNNHVVSPFVTSYLVDGLRHGYGSPKALVNKEALIAITNESFANDAILIEGSQVASVSLFDQQLRKVLTVLCPQAEAYGLWAPSKPGCPFVCIEPWCGIADRYDFNGDISERLCNHSLEPSNTYSFNYLIQINQ